MPPRRSPLLIAVFVISVVVALGLAFGILRDLRQGARDPREIRPWMTVGYVARGAGLDPREIDRRAGLPLPDPDPWTIRRIAEDRGVPPGEIIALIQRTVDEMQAERDRAGTNPNPPDAVDETAPPPVNGDPGALAPPPAVTRP